MPMLGVEKVLLSDKFSLHSKLAAKHCVRLIPIPLSNFPLSEIILYKQEVALRELARGLITARNLFDLCLQGCR